VVDTESQRARLGTKMKKTTYRVEFKGQTFKRTTERTYTHLVVGRKNIEADIAGAKAQRATYLKNHAFHCQEACEATRKYQHTPEQIAAMGCGYVAEGVSA